MHLPIDTTALRLVVAAPPEPVRDFETKRQRTDQETGAPLWAVQLVTFDQEGAQIISVKVAGDPGELPQGIAVRVTGLIATTWARGDRSRGGVPRHPHRAVDHHQQRAGEGGRAGLVAGSDLPRVIVVVVLYSGSRGVKPLGSGHAPTPATKGAAS